MSLTLVFPLPGRAGVDVGISISLPQPIVFVAPPALIVLPETYIYVVPGIEEEIFFYNGWWWRPWEGRWYRSRNYDSGWNRYQKTPSFYRQIPRDWRNDYREHRWKGNQWDHREIPHHQVQKNWDSWQKNKHWEKQSTWGVKGLRHQKPSQKQNPSREVKPQQNLRNDTNTQQDKSQQSRQQEKHKSEKNENQRQNPSQEVMLPQDSGDDNRPQEDKSQQSKQHGRDKSEKNENHNRK